MQGVLGSGPDCCNLMFSRECTHLRIEFHFKWNSIIHPWSMCTWLRRNQHQSQRHTCYTSDWFAIVILCGELNLRSGMARIAFLKPKVILKVFPPGRKVWWSMSSTAGWRLVCTSPSSLNHILSPLLTLIALSKYPLCLSVWHLFYFFSHNFKPTASFDGHAGIVRTKRAKPPHSLSLTASA